MHTACLADKEALFLSADKLGIQFPPIFLVPRLVTWNKKMTKQKSYNYFHKNTKGEI